MTQVGNGLFDAKHPDEALSVQEAELSMRLRHGHPEIFLLIVKTNLSNSYSKMGRLEQALQMDRDIYRGYAKLHGKQNADTLRAACNYANTLYDLRRWEEARSMLRETVPVSQRVLGTDHALTIKIRWVYGQSLYMDADATLSDLREAVETFEEIKCTARRVFGGVHPLATMIEDSLRPARAALRAREAGHRVVFVKPK